MQQLYASGTQHLLQVYFQAQSFTGPFYLGLAQGAIPDGIIKTLADVTEVTGTGYGRIEVDRTNDPTTGWTLTDDGLMQSPTVTFTNTNADPNNEWDRADYMFLTLSPHGTSTPNVLIGTIEMSSVVLAGGQSEEFIFSFSLYS